MNIDKTLLTIDEAAAFLNVKVSYMRSLVFAKKIPFLKIEGILRFELSSLQDFIKSKRIEPDI